MSDAPQSPDEPRGSANSAWTAPQGIPRPATTAEPEFRDGDPRPVRTAPPEVWLVALGMLAAAGLLSYPILTHLDSLFSGIFSSNDLLRAFSALALWIVVMVGGAAISLAALAVALIRGSRVAQWLTWLVAGAICIADLVVRAQSGNTAGESRNTPFVVAIVCAAVVVLVTALPGARAFFARDNDRPLGVIAAAVAGVFFGSCAFLEGLLLAIAGVFGAKYVWWGLGFMLFGIGLVAANWPLRAGRNSARLTVSVCYLGYLILAFVVAGNGSNTWSLATIVPCGISVGILCALWLPRASIRHFGSPQPLARPHSAVGAAAAVAALTVVVATIVGFSSASRGTGFTAAAGTLPNDTSTIGNDGTNTSTLSGGLSNSDASEAASASLQAMNGSGTVETCDGSSVPSISWQSYDDQLSPQSNSSYEVSAVLALADGSSQTVAFEIDTDVTGSPCLQVSSIQTQTPQTGTTDTSSPTDSTPSPSASSTDGGGPYALTDVTGPIDDGTCAGHAFGQVSDYLTTHSCSDLTQWLYTGTADGRAFVMSVSRVTLDSADSVQPFVSLITQDGTGDIHPLLDDGGGGSYDGLPSQFSTSPTLLAQAGNGAEVVDVYEAMWNDGSTTSPDDPTLDTVLSNATSLTG